MFSDLYDYQRIDGMKSLQPTDSWRLGVFSLGLSFSVYYVLQYLLTPLIWWAVRDNSYFELANDTFFHLYSKGLVIATEESITYSLIGLGSFLFAYHSVPTRISGAGIPFFSGGWHLSRVILVAGGLFVLGFALKAVKIALGANIAFGALQVSLISNPKLAFFLSLNWFHYLGFLITNIAYREANHYSHPEADRLRRFAYLINFIFIGCSLLSGSKAGTLFPILSLLIIRQYYVPLSIKKTIGVSVVLVVFVLAVKAIITSVVQGGDTATEFWGDMLYLLFYRINLSWVIAAIVDYGNDLFPDGTLGQFWVDFAFYSISKQNVLDGNVFGQALGLISDEDAVTGVAVTNIGDFFINFGLLGVVLGFAMNGALFRLFFETCLDRKPLYVLFYAAIWPILMHGLESPISVLYSTALKMLALCLVLHFSLASSRYAPGRMQSPRRG